VLFTFFAVVPVPRATGAAASSTLFPRLLCWKLCLPSLPLGRLHTENRGMAGGRVGRGGPGWVVLFGYGSPACREDRSSVLHRMSFSRWLSVPRA
jgi:hypothetical protein